ncbi:alpha/beta hydrolase [Kitasatospora sp. NPDC056327]|uniref:alpha/beta hydrolase n=1 Tax=Kitasatospora sp. NPDC056327 TaxID=3345785 RepID=UPI0035DCFACE
MTHDLPIDRRTVTVAALGAAALLFGPAARAGAAAGVFAAPAPSTAPVPSATPAPSARGLVLTLPAPSGPHRVGHRALQLTDHTRHDPWQPAIPFREVMVSVYYPARARRRPRPVPQLPPATARRFGELLPLVDPRLPAAGVDWGATLTHADEDAPVLKGRRRPVLLHSPAGGDPRGLGSSLAVDLASHGAVVVSVDHPGDGLVVALPAGARGGPERLRETELRGDPRLDPRLFRTVIDTRVADLRFVLDRLHRPARLPLPAGLAAVLDLGRTGAYGHSAGGSAAAELMHEDRRVRAAADLEGFLDHPPVRPGAAAEPFPVTEHGTDRPLLLMRSSGFAGQAELDRSWSALTRRSGGRVTELRVADAGHGVFADQAAVLPQLEAAGLVTGDTRAQLVGTAPPARTVPEVRAAVRGFFARHLGGR